MEESVGKTPNAPNVVFAESKCGKPLQASVRKNIMKVYDRLRKENPQETINSITKKTCSLTGISRATLFKIKSAAEAGLKFSTPGKKRPGAAGKRTRFTKYDDFTLSCLRQKVQSYLKRNEMPTLNKLLADLSSDPEILLGKLSRTTLHRLLKDLGFAFEKRFRSTCLMERSDVVLQRRKYLRDMRRFREEGKREIYFLDETWVDTSIGQNIIWQEFNADGICQSASSNLSPDIKTPMEKRSGLIVTHIGGYNGFVENALDVFQGKKSGDFRDEMSPEHFEDWFQNVALPKLQPNSIIVMDNVAYHSQKVEKIPSTSWTKVDIQEWLSNKNILWTADMLKLELLEKVGEIKSKYDVHRIDQIARLAGHTVLRLPPCHSELNPMELIWCQIKGHVARNNKSFQLKEVQALLEESIRLISPETWQASISHAILKEEELWEFDSIIEKIWDRKDSQTDCLSESESSDSNLDGMDFLDN